MIEHSFWYSRVREEPGQRHRRSMFVSVTNQSVHRTILAVVAFLSLFVEMRSATSSVAPFRTT